MINDENESSTFQIIMNKHIKIKVEEQSKSYLFIIASNETRDFVIIYIHQSIFFYCEKYTLKDLQKINFFQNFQNVNDIILVIKQLFEEKKDSIKIEEEEEKQITISLELELSVSGFNFNLRKEKIEFVLPNDNLDSMVRYKLLWFSSLFLFKEKEKDEKIKKEQEQNISNLKQEITNLKAINEELKLKLSNIEFTLTNGKNNRNNKVNKNINFTNSRIINESNINKMKFISQKIKRLFNEKFIKYEMVYSARINGDTGSKFHENCDYINNTLTLVYTNTKKIFGGFAYKTWNSLGLGRKIDSNSFIFSVDKQKIYNPILGEKKYHLYCSDNDGPCFYAFSIENFCLERGGTINEINKCNFESFEKEYEINDGIKNFTIKELEIYKVIFEN